MYPKKNVYSMKQENCQTVGCFNHGHYWRLCGHINGSVKVKTEIKKESKDRAVINRKEYAPKAAQFVKDHPVCEAGIAGICKGKSKCVHHKKGKSSTELLLDENYWLAVCLPCHRFLEDNPSFAKQKGFSLSRLSKIKPFGV